jgi:hypothetical protein
MIEQFQFPTLSFVEQCESNHAKLKREQQARVAAKKQAKQDKIDEMLKKHTRTYAFENARNRVR